MFTKLVKAHFLLGLVTALAVVGLVHSARYVTNFSKIQLDQSEIIDANGTTRVSVGATNAVTGNLTVSGTTTLTGATVLTIQSNAAPRTNLTPTAAYQFAFNTTANELCFSTGTTVSTWVVANGTHTVTACSN